MVQNTLQSTYGRRMPIGVNGAAATTHGWDADTRIAEGNITFGRAVSKGALDNSVVIAGNGYCGIAIRDISLVHDTADRYEDGDNVAVATRGDFWITVEDAVVAQTAIKYNATTGQLGSDGGVTIDGAYWVTSASAGGLAIARLATGAIDLTT
jgi:hypothetical protein